MDFQEYVNSRRGKKPNQEIVERWQTRVLPRGLHQQGEVGARQYLADYGKGIAAPKCILLAIQAENSGAQEMAKGFWKRAYELEFGALPVNSALATGNSGGSIVTASPKTIPLMVYAFPPNMQPGSLVTMQPVDGAHPREYYIESPNYWGQPKRDGNKVLTFGTLLQVWYQMRSLKERASPADEIDESIMNTARVIGDFIVEGELWYADCDGFEHRTAAQAATYNIIHGKGTVQPVMKYAIFSSLFWKGHKSETQRERIVNGGYIYQEIISHGHAEFFEYLAPATDRDQKLALSQKQKADGREGEVWFDISMSYYPGKRKDDCYPRTKYTIEIDVRVTRLTPTTAAGRPFGAIEVESLDGKPLGSIGTGFTLEQMHEIKRRFSSGTPLIIPVVAQGYTEKGVLFQGRLSEDFI